MAFKKERRHLSQRGMGKGQRRLVLLRTDRIYDYRLEAGRGKMVLSGNRWRDADKLGMDRRKLVFYECGRFHGNWLGHGK